MDVSSRRRAIAPFVVLALAACTLVAGQGTAEAQAKSKKVAPLAILVTNDDGVGAEGIAVLVDELRALPKVKVTVVAPRDQQSGTGGKTSEGPVATADATTATGYQAIAVDGFPADSVNHALDNVLTKTPNLVVSGINEGQNLGGITDISGTVGAARAAAQRGIPALAVSANLADPDYETAAELAADWVKKHRKQLAKKPKTPVLFQALNVPTCTTGTLRGLYETVVAETADNALAPSDCTSTLEDPADDITAYINGYASLTSPSITPAPTS